MRHINVKLKTPNFLRTIRLNLVFYVFYSNLNILLVLRDVSAFFCPQMPNHPFLAKPPTLHLNWFELICH